MKVITSKFVVWLMSLTTLMRYFVIAVLFHVLILFVLGTIKIAGAIPKIAAIFGGGALPPPKVDDVDPDAALREFSYNGPTLGDGSGTPGKGPGGIPTAVGDTKTEYKASIASVESSVDNQVQEVIGVVSDSANAVARLQGSALGGIAAPTTGLGEGKIGTAGVRGPGGGGFGHRLSGPIRAQKIKDGGGTGETEKAVLAALRWLKEHQESNGSWGPSNPDAMTALAVLCFLGHGETPDSEEFGPTITRGLSYIASIVGPEGMVKSRNMYAQGAVTLALSEAYGMTQSPQAREPLDRAISAILLSQKTKKTNQADIGGWRYTPTSADADVSVTGWLVMGLKSAKLAGISISEEPYEMASKYLWNMYADSGGFGYSSPGRGPATTAVGILCQQFLGHNGDKRLKKALDFYKEQKVDWDNPGSGTLYGWYYATQAMFQGGGAYWAHWNHEIRDTLVKKQASDGHWDYPGKQDNKLGPVFSTTLCCLMLEVYYRYLPIYQEMEKGRTPVNPPGIPGRSASTG